GPKKKAFCTENWHSSTPSIHHSRRLSGIPALILENSDRESPFHKQRGLRAGQTARPKSREFCSREPYKQRLGACNYRNSTRQ
ncbi:hypothetical protein CEXT_92231, partial [Caerostris extrusa]